LAKFLLGKSQVQHDTLSKKEGIMKKHAASNQKMSASDKSRDTSQIRNTEGGKMPNPNSKEGKKVSERDVQEAFKKSK
jgi:hypothetical protein